MDIKRLEEYSLIKIRNNNRKGLSRLLPDYTNPNDV